MCLCYTQEYICNDLVDMDGQSYQNTQDNTCLSMYGSGTFWSLASEVIKEISPEMSNANE